MSKQWYFDGEEALFGSTLEAPRTGYKFAWCDPYTSEDFALVITTGQSAWVKVKDRESILNAAGVIEACDVVKCQPGEANVLPCRHCPHVDETKTKLIHNAMRVAEIVYKLLEEKANDEKV